MSPRYIPPPSLASSLSLPLCWPNFLRTREENARGKCLHTHSIDPLATVEIPCHPSTPSFPNVSHPPHLSSTITPSPLPFRSLPLSLLQRTRAGVASLPSFSPLTVIPLLALFDTASIPTKLFVRTQDENVKPVLHHSTTGRQDSTQTHSRACPFQY